MSEKLLESSGQEEVRDLRKVLKMSSGVRK